MIKAKLTFNNLKNHHNPKNNASHKTHSMCKEFWK